jgi:hypothetical protein
VLFLITLLTSLVDIWDLLDRLLRIEETDRQFDDKLGSSYASRITIPSNKLVKIDFIRREHINLPVNETIAVPEVPVRWVSVILESGGPISFSTASDPYIKSDMSAGIVLSGEKETYEVESPRPTITRLNIVASNQAVVRIILVV